MQMNLKKFLESQNNKALEFDAEFKISKTYSNDLEKKSKKDEEEGSWILEGYASTGDLDTQNSIIKESAIISGAASLSKYKTLLFNHDMDRPIGKILLAEARSGKLFVKCSISKSEPEIWEKIKDGTLSKFSIKGFITDADEENINGDDILVIKDMFLVEASIVSIPANVEANVLNWYIEKAFKPYFSFSKEMNEENMPSSSNNETDEDETETLSETIDDLISEIKNLLPSFDEEDKNKGIDFIQWLQLMAEKYITEKMAKSIKEDMPVKKSVNLEKNPEIVDDEKDGSKDIVTKSVIDQTENEDESVENEKDVVIKTASENGFAKQMLSVVEEMKVIAKGVVDCVDLVNKKAEEIDSVQDELKKSLNEIKDIFKALPVRKSSIPSDQEEDERQEVSALEKSRKRVKNFDNLPPQEQLRQVLAEQFDE